MDLFRNNRVRELRTGLPANLAKYVERKAWAHKPASGTLSCSLEPAVPLDLALPAGEDLKDLENSILVHRAFPGLTPLQARDPRLWTRLGHVECWNYMRRRWDVARHLEDTDKATRYALAHYFVARNESRALLRHGIARLWWYAHLTHDPTRGDPYELTAVLLSSLDIAQQLLERNMGRAPELRTGFLDVLRTQADSLGATAGQRRERIRQLAKSLNLRGGVTILDALTRHDVEAMLQIEL